MSDLFSQAAHWTGRQCGRASVFMAAVVLIIAWAVTGPFFHYSDTWQLIINTSTTIVTFLMVFLLQNTQNRDTAAIQLKLDELIRANQNARNMMLCLEDLSEDELKKVKATFESLAAAPAAAGHVRATTEQLRMPGMPFTAPPQNFTRQRKSPPASLKERSMADDRTIRGAADRSRINMTMTAARTHTSVSPPNPKHARAAP